MANKNDRPIGFVLVREYPGCTRKVGDFEKYTTGEFLKYPGVWKPVYQESTHVHTEKHIVEITVRRTK